MLHDAVAAQLNARTTSVDERRRSGRIPFPAEMTIAWHHEMPTTMRYQIVDVSDDGFRIRSSTPLMQGMTGTALRLLPEGQDLGHPVMVAWVRKCKADADRPEQNAGDASSTTPHGHYEIGLRRF